HQRLEHLVYERHPPRLRPFTDSLLVFIRHLLSHRATCYMAPATIARMDCYFLVVCTLVCRIYTAHRMDAVATPLFCPGSCWLLFRFAAHVLPKIANSLPQRAYVR